jgi:UNC-50 family
MQAVQVSTDGLRDGRLGDDASADRAQESLQVDILPQTYIPLDGKRARERAGPNTLAETRNTWHRPDPSFTYLLSFFLLLTSFAWSLAYTPAFSSVIKLALMFVFVHFLAGSLVVSGMAYLLVGRLLGPGIAGLPGRRRQQGLFGPPGGGTRGAEALEFGYCFDVSIRAFFPPYVLLYIIQYILMPAINHSNRVSAFFANLLYLAAGVYWSLIIFLGYNALHFLHHTQLLLSPMIAWVIIWLVCTIFGVNLEMWGTRWMFLGVKA